ncbi:DUF2786 domain-containing protein, partial [Pseudomonas aeruginosa]|uniref:DUF2786 domain-containing protein n=1 Tax=Pseudomonas aeruginosa TaxID=287 RepID=UPI000ADD54E7
MDQDRILDKIKKCLEMAKGRGSNPNEAEIALRHAHKLMEAYNLEMGDVLASMAGEARVPAGYRMDAKGRLVPEEMIKPIDLERDRLVQEI